MKKSLPSHPDDLRGAHLTAIWQASMRARAGGLTPRGFVIAKMMPISAVFAWAVFVTVRDEHLPVSPMVAVSVTLAIGLMVTCGIWRFSRLPKTHDAHLAALLDAYDPLDRPAYGELRKALVTEGLPVAADAVCAWVLREKQAVYSVPPGGRRNALHHEAKSRGG